MSALAETHQPLSGDEPSCEYEFEDIEIEEAGLRFGSFYGTAELASNRDGEFYVRHIVLNGTRGHRTSERGVLWPIAGILHLRLPARDCRTFQAHLFRKIEEALYADTRAKEWFTQEMEPA